MKFSKKLLFLPCLALSIFANSAFAGVSASHAHPDDMGITPMQTQAWVPQPRNRWQRFADCIEVKSCAFNPLASLAAGLATGVCSLCKSKNDSLAGKIAESAASGLLIGALTYFNLNLATCLICVSAETD